MQRQRFELKYRIQEEEAQQIRDFVSAHLQLDENGIGRPNLSYPVHSLYLDSDDLATYWMTVNGDKNRFKLRLRFYDDRPDTPVYCEIKSRVDQCISKQRGAIRKEAVPWLLAGQLPAPEQLLSRDPKQRFAVEQFWKLTEWLCARPKMHVAYQREAWVDPGSDAVRVTFDRHVLGEPERTTCYRTEMTNPCRPFGNEVILELKFTNRFPKWAREMVEIFELTRGTAAKYCECVEIEGEQRLTDSALRESGFAFCESGDVSSRFHRGGIFSESRRTVAPRAMQQGFLCGDNVL